MATKRLRAVTEADAPAKPKTLTEAIEGESYLDILIAQRREMVRDVADVGGPAKAALHRQIALASKEIALLQAQQRTEEQEGANSAEVEDGDFDASAV